MNALEAGFVMFFQQSATLSHFFQFLAAEPALLYVCLINFTNLFISQKMAQMVKNQSEYFN